LASAGAAASRATIAAPMNAVLRLIMTVSSDSMHAGWPRFRRSSLLQSKQATESRKEDGRAEIIALFAPAQRRLGSFGQTASMKRIALPAAEITVDEVMRRWPATIRVFLDFNMHCIGCPMGTFHSVDEACREHGVDLAAFLRCLLGAAGDCQPAEVARTWPSARTSNL